MLQEFNEQNFRLKNYIVYLAKEISPLSFLTDSDSYTIPSGSPASNEESNSFVVNVLNKHDWPTSKDLNLDEAQYSAYVAALTQEITVIQGPPGTGKTFLGLRIVETLLSNANCCPILIACYTNHALDQFLEGISKFCDRKFIVRIGRTENEALLECQLSRIKAANKPKGRKSRQRNRTPNERSRADITIEMETIVNSIKALQHEKINAPVDEQSEIKKKIEDLEEKHGQQSKLLKDLESQENIEIIKKAKIIGITTTGAAKHRYIIDEIKPRVAGKNT